MVQKTGIGHEGIVKNISNRTVDVVISSQSACAGCHAKSMCGVSENTQKTITAERPDFDLKVGEKVIVYASIQNAVFSVIVAYVIPSVILVGSIPIGLALGFTETFAAIGALFGVVVYYLFLYLLRRSIGKKIKFTIVKIAEQA
ncbi:SoxR reducing system RseC family protein [uncultured Odoribacter sp.]|uniref:SoxR reducing system RseC family protein n=1 Tax=uncultured Odoribacter sp. TaxID=876416 RepID=UPI00262263C6|nr:SoxR reducing system RseC family protein [uncultured Odoribacter sp.]